MEVLDIILIQTIEIVIIIFIVFSRITIRSTFIYFLIYFGIVVASSYVLFYVLQAYTNYAFYKATSITSMLYYYLFFLLIIIVTYYSNNKRIKYKKSKNLENFKFGNLNNTFLRKHGFYTFFISLFVFLIFSHISGYKYGLLDEEDRGAIFAAGGGLVARLFTVANFLSVLFFGLLLLRKFNFLYLILILISIFETLLTGSRANAIFPFLLVVFIGIVNNQIRFNFYKIFVFLLSILLLILIMHNVPKLREGYGMEDIEFVESFEDISILGTSIVNSSNLMQDVPSVYDYWYGKKMFVRPILSLFPNFFWNIFSVDARKIKYNIDYRYSNSIGVKYSVRQGLIGDLYDNFGSFGIFFGAFIVGLIFSFIDSKGIKETSFKSLLYYSLAFILILSINIDAGNGFFTRVVNYSLIPYYIYRQNGIIFKRKTKIRTT